MGCPVDINSHGFTASAFIFPVFLSMLFLKQSHENDDEDDDNDSLIWKTTLGLL